MRHPIPLVFRPVGKASRLPHPVIINSVIIDIRLICKRRPCAKYERILLHCLHRFRKIDRHETTGHFPIRFLFSVILGTTEIPKIPRQKLSTPNSPTIVIQIIVDQVCVVSVNSRIFIFLIFRSIS